MYEKPLYLTKDGYKRLSRNPCKGDALPAKTTARKIRDVKLRIPYKGKGISDEAAKMIAQVLKGMLKDTK